MKLKIGSPGSGKALESTLNAWGFSATKYQPKWSHGDPFQLKKSASHWRPGRLGCMSEFGAIPHVIFSIKRPTPCSVFGAREV